jgi:flagellar motor switch protein FliG
MTLTRDEVTSARVHQKSPPERTGPGLPSDDATISSTDVDRQSVDALLSSAIAPVRKAAILLVSLEQSQASQLLSNLDRASMEAVTWEIARLEHIEPYERVAVLEEFYGLGLRRLCFGFDDLVNMSDDDIRASLDLEDIDTWSLALAGTAAPARAKVLGALPASSADRLQTHLEQLGPFRLSESEAAQIEIAERIRRLYDRGRISLPEPSGRDEFLI